jgi:hypothetical protein
MMPTSAAKISNTTKLRLRKIALGSGAGALGSSATDQRLYLHWSNSAASRGAPRQKSRLSPKMARTVQVLASAVDSLRGR